MTPTQKSNAALTDVCRLLLDEYELTQEQIANLAKDIPGECEAMRDNAAEAAWCAQQERLMESGGPDNSTYRRQLIEAGRGHLLGGS